VVKRRSQRWPESLGSQPTGDVSHKPGGRLPWVQFKVAVLVFQCLSSNAPMYLADEQTSVSSSLTSACVDSAWPTLRCVLFDSQTTPSAIGVSQRLDHACGTHYLLNYDNVTVSENSNGCWRHTCSGTTALCDILVKSAILLTYLLAFHHAHGYLPSRRASQPLDSTKFYCRVTEAHELMKWMK